MSQNPILRRCAALTLVLAVAGGTAPLSAAELDLALERTEAVRALRLELDVSKPDLGADRRQPENLPDLRTALDWRTLDAGVLAAARQDDPDVGQGNRTWRWLKRHWWVPVLVAGAVALAVQDDTPDDGEDDD